MQRSHKQQKTAASAAVAASESVPKAAGGYTTSIGGTTDEATEARPDNGRNNHRSRDREGFISMDLGREWEDFDMLDQFFLDLVGSSFAEV